jgi:hypothetical protein
MCSENQQSKPVNAEQEEALQSDSVVPAPINLEADLREFAHLIPKVEKQ